MNRNPLVLAATTFALGSFAALATAQTAADPMCTAPGLTVLEDATGDVNAQDSPVGIPLGYADIVSVSVAQPAQDDGESRLVFTLKMAEAFPLAQLPPVASWYTSFKSVGGGYFGVRMNTGPDGTVAFQSYTLAGSLDVGEGSISDGRFADAPKAAKSGSYGDDGTITITVDAKAIGAAKAGELTQFNAGTVQRVGEESIGGAAFVLDGAPDDLSRRGAVAVAEGPTCTATSKSGLAGAFGGSLGFGLLLPLIGLLGLRRRS